MSILSYSDLAEIITNLGDEVTTIGGKKTKEIRGVQIGFKSGLFINRVMMNHRLAFLEGFMMCAGIFDKSLIEKVAPSANLALYDFQSDYGPRIINQLPQVIWHLNKSPYTRKAVLTLPSVRFSDPNDDLYFADIACTSSIQFLIRDAKLFSIVTMRSCDFVYGFPMDIVMFSMLQKFVASILSVEADTTMVQIGSCHIYEETADKATEGPNKTSQFDFSDAFKRRSKSFLSIDNAYNFQVKKIKDEIGSLVESASALDYLSKPGSIIKREKLESSDQLELV